MATTKRDNTIENSENLRKLVREEVFRALREFYREHGELNVGKELSDEALAEVERSRKDYENGDYYDFDEMIARSKVSHEG